MIKHSHCVRNERMEELTGKVFDLLQSECKNASELASVLLSCSAYIVSEMVTEEGQDDFVKNFIYAVQGMRDIRNKNNQK